MLFTIIVMTVLVVWAFKNIAQAIRLSELIERKFDEKD